jgi:hypothetical protein
LTNNRQKISQQITKVFDELLDEYMHEDDNISSHDDIKEIPTSVTKINSNNEYKLIFEDKVFAEQKLYPRNDFLNSPCSCGKLCKDSLSFDEIAKSRKEFSSLNWDEKNVFILSQLNVFMHHSDKSRSARQIKTRIRQKFDYHISIDRPVCKDVFLFYYGETIARLKRLQKHQLEAGISSTAHGNIGRLPSNACSEQNQIDIKTFIVNYVAIHGMPDPGRDLRHGKG